MSSTVNHRQHPSRSSRGYGGVAQAVHWTALMLLVGLYALAWSVDGAGSREAAAWLIMMHRSIGLLLLALTLFRIGWRRITRAPALPDDMPKAQRAAARAVSMALYVLSCVQPLLGLIASQAHGDRISVFGVFALPPFIAPDHALSRQVFALHGTVALLFLTLVGVHASAALYHHFVRRDDVLRGMLPRAPRPRGRIDLSEA